MRVLILGGTSEASALGRALIGDGRFDATFSLAGRTQNPARQPLPTRVGGFGGVDGLARYLLENRVDALIDATHPFAVQMTRNAALAARQTAIPLLVVNRPAWEKQPGDLWVTVPDVQTAAQALGTDPRRVLLTIGQKDLSAFTSAPCHDYVIRSVDAPHPQSLPPRAEVITARGPFAVSDECALLRRHKVDLLVTKNSGGTATVAKLVAARLLQLRVIMISRPAMPAVETVATVAEALAWLQSYHAPARRGV